MSSPSRGFFPPEGANHPHRVTAAWELRVIPV